MICISIFLLFSFLAVGPFPLRLAWGSGWMLADGVAIFSTLWLKISLFPFFFFFSLLLWYTMGHSGLW